MESKGNILTTVISQPGCTYNEQQQLKGKKVLTNFQYKKINSAGSSPAMSMRAHTHNKYISFFPRKTWIGMWYRQIQSCDGKNTIFFVDMWMYRKKER